MDFWLILLIASVVFLFLEMFTPTLFFINLALAAAVSAIFAYLGFSIWVITIIFLVVSIVSIGFVRPLLLKKMNTKEHTTGIEDKYIGQVATVVNDVTKTSGRVAIYGEEWQAVLSENDADEFIPQGAKVKIISNNSIIFTVEKIKEN